MMVGDFEIVCLQCGSTDIAIVDIHKDSEFDEDYKKLKCAGCGSEVEI